MPSILGSEEKVISLDSLRFKKLLIFLIKSSTSSFEKALANDYIGIS